MKRALLFLFAPLLIACGPGVELPAELLLPERAGELVVADLNNDGLLDVAAASGTNAFTFFGRPKGEFSPPVPTALSPVTLRATLSGVDLDGDGAAELINTGTVIAEGNHRSQVFRAQGEGYGAPVEAALGGGIFASPYHAVADFDGDGAGDLAVIQNDQVFVYAGDGSGFEETPRIIPLPLSLLSRSLATGDIDGDGLADLAGCGAEGGVVLFGAPSQEGATLEAPVVFSTSDLIKTRVADLDGDGRAEVLAVGRALPQVEAFSFSAARAVTPLPPFTVGQETPGRTLLGYIDFVPADFDFDGDLDIAAIRTVSDASSGALAQEVGLSLAQGTAFLPDAILALTVSSEAPEIEAGDLDGDRLPEVIVSDSDRIRIGKVGGK